MTSVSLKKEIHKAVDVVQDNEILEAIFAILHKSILHERMQPFSLEEFYARNSQSQKEIKKKRLISHGDIKKRFSSK